MRIFFSFFTCHFRHFTQLSQSQFREPPVQQPVAVATHDGTYFATKWKVKRAAGEAAMRIPRGSNAGTLHVRTDGPPPRAEQLPAILFILMSRIVSSFRFFRRVGCTAALRPSSLSAVLGLVATRSARGAIELHGQRGGRFFCASFAQNLVSIPSRKRRRSPIIE